MIQWSTDEHNCITIKIWDQQLIDLDESKIDALPQEAQKAKGYFLAWALDEAKKLARDLTHDDYKETQDDPFTVEGRMMVLQTMEVTIKGVAK